MRTRTKKTTLLLSLVILLSTYFFASASLINIASNPHPLQVVMYSPISDYSETNFSFKDEDYIDDIPFNTECTYIENKYNQAISIEFSLEEESYIDDIPQEIYKGNL